MFDIAQKVLKNIFHRTVTIFFNINFFTSESKWKFVRESLNFRPLGLVLSLHEDLRPSTLSSFIHLTSSFLKLKISQIFSISLTLKSMELVIYNLLENIFGKVKN